MLKNLLMIDQIGIFQYTLAVVLMVVVGSAILQD